MFKHHINDKNISLWKTFKRKIFKERFDMDITELSTLLSISHKKTLKDVTIENVRASYIESSFDTAADLINSAHYLITCMKELKNVNASTFPNLEKREIELEKWIDTFIETDSGLDSINFQMLYTTNIIKTELENLILKHEANRHSYYKRLSKIYFQEFKTWLDLMEALSKTKQS